MSIQSQLSDILTRIQNAEKRVGRPHGSAKLIAVSKTFPAQDVLECYECGQKVFGENKVQEGLSKKEALPTEIIWHLIGPLQRNKARKAIENFDLIHAVDSLKLATYMNGIAQELGKTPHILLEVNVGDEDSKFGFSIEDLKSEWNELLQLSHLKIDGLMCIPPPSDLAEDSRPYFKQLVRLRDELTNVSGVQLPELSMGMSHDFEIAVEEGATLVRVGSAIFGNRDYSH